MMTEMDPDSTTILAALVPIHGWLDERNNGIVCNEPATEQDKQHSQ